jgi:hypothetical protein
MKYLWVGAVVAGCAVGVWGQGVRAGAVREFPAYKVYPGVLDEGGFPISAARLCTIEAKARCFALVDLDPADKDDPPVFGLRPSAQRIKLSAGGSLVLFHAYTRGGSGSTEMYVLLHSDPDGRLRNTSPKVFVSNLGDVAMWDLPTVSPVPVLVTADFIWGDGEAHYGDHFFEVRMYVYDAASDRYKLRHTYRTAHKYPGIDNWESQPEVLEGERSRIIEVLGAK